MTRSQVVAVVLAVGIVVVGIGYAWREGAFAPRGATSPVAPMASSAPTPSSAALPAPAPAESAPAPSVMVSSTPTPSATPLVAPVKPQEQATAKPSAAPVLIQPQAVPETPPPSPPAPKVAALPPQQPVNPGRDIPVFDTVRVEPSGDTVVAGHGAPDAKFALVSGDKILSEADGDGAGNFVLVPPPLAPGSYLLALRSTAKDGTALDSHQNIAVSVPPKGQSNVVVALAEPGKPSVILSDTQNKSAPPPTDAQQAQPQVAFKTAEVDNGGFYASGTATPDAHLRIYLNGSILTDVTAGQDGHWSLTIGKGMTPGHFAVRADMIDVAGKVLARAEVPFEVPVALAEAEAVPQPPASTSPPAAAAPPDPTRPASPEAAPSRQQVVAVPPAASANDAVVAQIQTTTVVRGDSLWRISRKVFGRGIRYTLIYEANAKQIRDPSLIYPGQVFVLPHIVN